MTQFGLSQSVPRVEDDALLQGKGRFTDDVAVADPLHGFMVRSPHPAARILTIDRAAAEQADGVVGVILGDELAAAGMPSIPCLVTPKSKPGTDYRPHGQPILAADQVRFVGDNIAFVVARSLHQARQAAELIEIDYDTLPAVVACDAAADPAAPQLWPDAPNNICFDYETGDRAAVDEAFRRAARSVSIDVVNNRVVLNALECRAAIGEWDGAAEKYTLTAGTQMPNPMKNQLAKDIFRVPADRIRVVVGDVGGGFGGKNSLFPEYVLCLYAARKFGRPVKWAGERADAFISDFHGRDNVTRGELALDDEGRILALRLTAFANLGAYTASRGTVSPVNGLLMLSNGYRIPAVYASMTATYTNTVPTDPYRGAGRPETIYLIERLIDHAAQEIRMDRVEFRRLNAIPPEAFPYAAPTGLVYDHADLNKIMDEAMAKAGWSGFADRARRSAAAGLLRGIGMANYIERCGGSPQMSETADLSFGGDGTAVLRIGTMSNGQGHQTAYRQIIHHYLGLPFDKISVIQGDTDEVKTGTGTGGSWSMTLGGGAIVGAAYEIIDAARPAAAEELEVAPGDLTFEEGQFRVPGTDLAIALELLAGKAGGFKSVHRYQPENFTFPYGCHICEVEIDPETGSIEILDYVSVHDFGVALNPLLLAGQVHGGVVQGLGQAVFEHTAYSPDGQLLSGSFMDYCLPRAKDLPAIRFYHRDTPDSANPMGIKGCGEAGATGAPPAVVNAVVDALRPLGIRHIDMPLTPGRVWETLAKAKAAS